MVSDSVVAIISQCICVSLPLLGPSEGHLLGLSHNKRVTITFPSRNFRNESNLTYGEFEQKDREGNHGWWQ